MCVDPIRDGEVRTRRTVQESPETRVHGGPYRIPLTLCRRAGCLGTNTRTSDGVSQENNS